MKKKDFINLCFGFAITAFVVIAIKNPSGQTFGAATAVILIWLGLIRYERSNKRVSKRKDVTS